MNVADLTQIKAGDILPISLGETFPVAIGQSELFSALIVEDKDKLFLSELAGKMRIAMSKQEDILAGDFGLTDEVAPVAKSADAETLVTRPEDRFSDSMTLLKRIPVTLTLEVSSVEIMLADLLNIDDDTVIELDKLAGEPLDIKVNNILLGKAEVVVVNEKYGLRVLEFNTRDINDRHHETPHSTDAGPWAAGACAAGVGLGRRYCAA